ncbi:uncharacterized protein LOC132034962 [Lycium ferocissimum]|uniref:uncharacterized protein LOC132034962 n=1 Tax=Lycium ferocissimum TaxID=112874 RepID=UPI002814E3E9|nr:uncharacterized protein LOC132034962 [Lycium ferocissimum]
MAYNVIVGRPRIHAIKAVPSTYHHMVKFLMPWGIEKVRGEQRISRDCYAVAIKKGVPKVEPFEPEREGKKDKQVYQILHQTESNIDDVERDNIQDPLTKEQSTAVVEDLDPMSFDDTSPKKRKFVRCKLHQPRIAPEVETHKLHIDPYHRPVRQPRRRFPDDRSRFIEEEAQRLLDAGSIRPLEHTEWVSNVVVVPKKNGKMRMCVDLTDLNKACPKDPFPLPYIDQMVDATAGHELLSFLDAYLGYHQIKMNPADQTKTI